MMFTVCFLFFSLRYINSAIGKVMQDIVSSQLYKDQFDAIQDCFRIIGFSEEVWYADLLTLSKYAYLNILWSMTV